MKEFDSFQLSENKSEHKVMDASSILSRAEAAASAFGNDQITCRGEVHARAILACRIYRLCLGIRAMDNRSNLLIVQNLDSTERIGISHS